MKHVIVIVCAWLLAGCAQVPLAVQPMPPELLADSSFGPPTETISVDHLFQLSPEMLAAVNNEIGRTGANPQQRLYKALFTDGKLLVEYDASRTRPPAETFAERSGNCLSLVLLTAAVAKELGLPVTYQSVQIEETWSRSGSLAIASHHANITIGRARPDATKTFHPYLGWAMQDILRAANVYSGKESPAGAEAITIDFLPPEDAGALRVRTIDEGTILAMYMNNRAAEALMAGQIDNAYWWARKAVVEHPAYANAYNTLAVVYTRRGDLAHAEATLRHALQAAPSDTNLLGNLAPVLAKAGKQAEAAEVRERVTRLDPHPPFEFFDLGMAAVKRGAWAEARDQFKREVRRAPYNAEFHFWLAVAATQLGEYDTARDEMQLAAENSTNQKDNARYSNKLAVLRNMHLH